jgi:DNA-binding FadR family transcriptional regulator
VAEQIKMWIVRHRMTPGDRLPQEKELIEHFGVSKSTVREALKALEVQGMVDIVTGPGGGAAISAVSDQRAMDLLRNYFYFRTPTVSEIYAVRKLLEPELAVAAIDHLTDEHFARLASLLQKESRPTESAEDRREQRAIELEFHNVLVDACPNAWLALSCRFMNQFLAEYIVFRKIYMSPQREFGRDNLTSHEALLVALKRRDKADVRAIMTAHMEEAASHMSKLDGTVDRTFLLRGS